MTTALNKRKTLLQIARSISITVITTITDATGNTTHIHDNYLFKNISYGVNGATVRELNGRVKLNFNFNMEMNKKDYKPKHLMYGASVFNEDMELSWYHGSGCVWMIPLNKEILEPLGFESVYDEFTSEIYFQRDIQSVRVRVLPMDSRIVIIDLKYLHTLVDAKAEGLNEIENYLACMGINLDGIIDREVERKINEFGQRYFEYYEAKTEMFKSWGLKDGGKEDNKCVGCNNVKGCVTCTDGDQWCHITEQKD